MCDGLTGNGLVGIPLGKQIAKIRLICSCSGEREDDDDDDDDEDEVLVVGLVLVLVMVVVVVVVVEDIFAQSDMSSC